ncbi:hypothetical protein FJZ31_04500 [Candidatus Poribacteria bacterium]|nr:hypothetical protein [Candidatus Poribacteria bacterium]
MAWYDKDSDGKSRLVLECKAMKEVAKDFVLKIKSDGTLFWKGSITPVENCFILEIQYPANFPFDAPEVYVKSPKLPEDTPHLLDRPKQKLCLFHSGYAKKVGIYNPGKTTAATMLGHAINWLLCFEVWLVLKTWPIRESPTDDD